MMESAQMVRLRTVERFLRQPSKSTERDFRADLLGNHPADQLIAQNADSLAFRRRRNAAIFEHMREHRLDLWPRRSVQSREDAQESLSHPAVNALVAPSGSRPTGSSPKRQRATSTSKSFQQFRA